MVHFGHLDIMFGNRPNPNRYKKDVGVILLLTPLSGLGEPTRKISNAASPRQG